MIQRTGSLGLGFEGKENMLHGGFQNPELGLSSWKRLSLAFTGVPASEVKPNRPESREPTPISLCLYQTPLSEASLYPDGRTFPSNAYC
jgi:hypothetical protein